MISYLVGMQSLRAPAVLLLLLSISVLVPAQSYRGSIRGKVLDPNGNAMAGAKVSAKSHDTGMVREVITGEGGAYVLAELPAGAYVVMAEAGGLSPVALNVVVNVGLDTTANLDLTQIQKKIEQTTVI